jgi:hypothetical protein
VLVALDLSCPQQDFEGILGSLADLQMDQVNMVPEPFI